MSPVELRANYRHGLASHVNEASGKQVSQSSVKLQGAEISQPTNPRPRPRELRAFFSCMAWRAISGPLSKRKRRLDSLEAAQGAPCWKRLRAGGEGDDRG